jgi:hypothetical protein
MNYRHQASVSAMENKMLVENTISLIDKRIRHDSIDCSNVNFIEEKYAAWQSLCFILYIIWFCLLKHSDAQEKAPRIDIFPFLTSFFFFIYETHISSTCHDITL